MLSSRCATALTAITLLAACHEDPVSPALAEAVPLAGGPTASLTLPCTKHWKAAVSGGWFVAKNWNPIGVPGAGAIVCLDAVGKTPYTVSLNASTTIAGLVIGGSVPAAAVTLLADTTGFTGVTVTDGTIVNTRGTLQFGEGETAEQFSTGYLINNGTIGLGGRTVTWITADSMINQGTLTTLPVEATAAILSVAGPVGFRNSGTVEATRAIIVSTVAPSSFVMQGGAITGASVFSLTGADTAPATFEWQAGDLPTGTSPVSLSNATLVLASPSLVGSLILRSDLVPSAVQGDVGPGVALTLWSNGAGSFDLSDGAGGPLRVNGTLGLVAAGAVTVTGPGVVVESLMTINHSSLLPGSVSLSLDSLVNAGTLTVEDSSLVTLANGKLLRNRGSLVTPGSDALLLAGGTLVAEAGSSHNGTVVMQAGRIEGSGSLDTVIALAGAIEPGSPVGALSLTTLTMSPPAGLGLDLAGTAPGSFDQLLVAGQVKLAGTLTVRELAPFVAGVCGQVLPVLLDHSTVPRGAFGKFSGLNPGVGRAFRLYLQPDSIALVGYNPLPLVSKGPASLTVAEGGLATSYSICLQHAPTADVTVTPTSLAGQLQPMTPVSFTPTAWGLPRSVSVAAVDDAIYEAPPQQDDITHVVSSTDPAYQFAGLANEPVTILDNDGSANLELTILNAAPVVASGNSFTLNLRVGNSGPDISVGSTFSLPASAGYHFVSATGVLGCAADPVTGIRCDLPSVAAGGASFTFDVTLAADAAGSYPTTYTLTSIQPDPAPANNARLQTITVQ